MSWEQAGKWYHGIVGEKGHYYHERVVLPNTLRLLALDGTARLLDVACGQGILARHIPQEVYYTGIDASSTLIREARRLQRSRRFLVADACLPLPLKERDFTHAALLLALQNIACPLDCLKHVRAHLSPKGKLLIVLNHPCFRIPRQSSWGVDAQKKVQYRRIDRYLSPLKIPITTHPSKKDSSTTLSYHYPLSAYTGWLKEAGFAIEVMEEWCSDKSSTGGAAAMENRSRREIPLFLAVLAYTSP
jgi:SAM-dependent methyltransferase